jgi:hypothetical protein
VLGRKGVFARQGSVVATWRAYRGRRLGPYFRLAFREDGRQRSIYLGRCRELARRVGSLLAGLQRPLRQRRVVRRLEAQVQASLKRFRAKLAEALAPLGIRIKGSEFRGGRRALARYVAARYGGGPLPEGMDQVASCLEALVAPWVARGPPPGGAGC